MTRLFIVFFNLAFSLLYLVRSCPLNFFSCRLVILKFFREMPCLDLMISGWKSSTKCRHPLLDFLFILALIFIAFPSFSWLLPLQPSFYVCRRIYQLFTIRFGRLEHRGSWAETDLRKSLKSDPRRSTGSSHWRAEFWTFARAAALGTGSRWTSTGCTRTL
jgi:hypothetical protein